MSSSQYPATGPINPNTGRPFAAGDTINARNRAAANEYDGWQQANQINQWNREIQGRIDYAKARQSALGQSSGGTRTPRRQMTGGTPASPLPQQISQPSQPQDPAPARPNPLASYQSGFNANQQAINQGNVVGRMEAESQFEPQLATGDGARAVQDLRRSQVANDSAQLRRGMQLQNSQQHIKNQIARSELIQSGLANQAKIYGDRVGRETSQIGLAAQLQGSMIQNRNAFMQALMRLN